MTNRTLPLDNVSRETMEKLDHFVDLMTKWTQSINLIAPNTVSDIWNRHIVDSAQLINMAPIGWKTWVDLGSGGGLPGLVIAILMGTGQKMTLIESDTRKAMFLNTAKRELNLTVDVHAKRIETVPDIRADVLTARALAPLTDLLIYTQSHLSENGVALLQKGRRYQEELDQAHENWHFDLQKHPSITSSDSQILSLSRIQPSES